MLNTNPVPQTYNERAVSMFWEATSYGWLHRLWSALTRRTSRLLKLDDALRESKLKDSHYAGVKTVHIDKIRGTEGKGDAFDGEFNPTNYATRSRWISIMMQKLRGNELPPVDLVEVNGVYYVRDGHHRISVAHTLGQKFVDAQVTVFNVQRNWL